MANTNNPRPIQFIANENAENALREIERSIAFNEESIAREKETLKVTIFVAKELGTINNSLVQLEIDIEKDLIREKERLLEKEKEIRLRALKYMGRL